MFLQIIEKNGMFHALNAYNPAGDGFTLFLPTDEAFRAFIAREERYNNFDELLNDIEFNSILCRYHLVNKSIRTTEFPFGALPDSTATGDYLTIGIEIDADTSRYRANNLATVIISNIELTNGYIHVIDQVLNPITYSSYDWLKNNSDYSILSEVFKITGFSEKMGIYRTTNTGQTVMNRYTVLAEHDSVFENAEIYNIDDLIEKYANTELDFNNPENSLYQFAAYHLLEGAYYLDAFSGTLNYNTFSFAPVTISAGLEIKINQGIDTFSYKVKGSDTTWIDYLSLNYEESNINTKHGPIHLLDRVMEYYIPGRTERIFQFLEDPIIREANKIAGTYEFVDPNLFEVISWSGPESINYIKASGSGEKASNLDYIQIEGNFKFSYVMPKILPGVYKIELRMEATNQENATIEVFFDGQRLGSNFNLTSGGTALNPYYNFNVGTLETTSYKEHTIVINTLIPGIMKWDYVKFIPQ
jgi:uncharacterized surface protein with fasciclin (FAS1) repeats